MFEGLFEPDDVVSFTLPLCVKEKFLQSVYIPVTDVVSRP